MLRWLYMLLTALAFFTACSGDEEPADALLEKPPYKKLTDSIRQSPQHAQLYYQRGSLLYHNNQLLHAEQDLRKAWQLDPTEEYALSLTTILQKRNFDTAITFLQTALKQMPGSIALHLALARGYQAKGQPAKATTIADQILAQYPGQLDALLLKSELLNQQQKPEEALQTLEKAQAYAPNDLDIAYELAYQYAELKKPEALRLSAALIRADSTENVAKAFYIRATYYANTGQHRLALQHFDSASRRNYNFLDAYLGKGILLYQLKKYQEAKASFELGQKISPATADFYYWIGKVQQATGQAAEAKMNFLRAYSLDKTLVEAK